MIFINIILQKSVIGLCRDLRGITLAFNSRTCYMMLFDWMYPRKISKIIVIQKSAALAKLYSISCNYVNNNDSLGGVGWGRCWLVNFGASLL